MQQVILYLTVIFLLAYCNFGLLLFLLQARFLYRPSDSIEFTPVEGLANHLAP